MFEYEELNEVAKQVVRAEVKDYLENEFMDIQEIMENLEEHIDSEARQALYNEQGVFQRLV